MNNQVVSEKINKPKWRRRPECRPDDILDGALIEFCSCGFIGARVEDIAKHAGLSKGSVYLYFSSKEEMLKALVKKTVIPIADELKNIASHVNDYGQGEKNTEILRRMLHIIGERIMDEKVRSIPLLIIGEAGKFPELAQFYRDEVIEVVMKSLSIIIEQGIKQSEFKKVKATHAVRSLMSIIIMQVVWQGVFARNNENIFPIKDLINSHFDLFLNGILATQEN